ncbi:MAG: DsrE family protein [Bacteroidota bacterium]
MKNILFCLFLLATPAAIFAQNTEETVVSTKKHKVVFQLMTNDTLAQKALVRQIGHLLIAAPKSKIEVVCHNNGISLLQKNVTKQADKIHELSAKGVEFAACENTMRDRKIKREDLVQDCHTVPSGLLEVVLKQEKGWAYIKAGF